MMDLKEKVILSVEVWKWMMSVTWKGNLLFDRTSIAPESVTPFETDHSPAVPEIDTVLTWTMLTFALFTAQTTGHDSV